MRGLTRKVDPVIGAIAARQHGAVARRQLLDAGVSARMIEERIRSGLLIPVHRGVYLLAHGPRSPLAFEAAAVLACGPQALLSHRTAGARWALLTEAPESIELTVVGRNRTAPNGLVVRSISALADSELRRHEGIPITSPSLTLLDLAGTLGRHDLSGALNEARVQRLVTDDDLRASLAAHPNRRGASALRCLVDEERGPRITRSEAERRALDVMRAHGIEPDASDVAIGPYRVDFLFERERLAVEVDGYRYHGTPKRFVADRRRTNYLASKGIQLFPLTWVDLHQGAKEAMALLQATLSERRRLFVA
jgi:very-short-patch-repair endonuclease